MIISLLGRRKNLYVFLYVVIVHAVELAHTKLKGQKIPKNEKNRDPVPVQICSRQKALVVLFSPAVHKFLKTTIPTILS